MKFIFLYFALIFFSACTKNTDKFLRLEIQVQDKTLPIVLERTSTGLTLHNSNIQNELTKVDELTFEIPPYESALVFDDKEFKSGYWVRYNRVPEFKLPFTSTNISSPKRFSSPSKLKLEGEYEISLGNDKALGTFKTREGIIQGSIISPYGDFGHIEGFIDEENKIHLYSFDGIFSYIFEGDFSKDEIKNGKAYSGQTWNETFSAKLNPDFKVQYPKASDILVSEDTHLSFKVKSLNNALYQYDSRQIKKVQIVQIFGSWCPNCQDETRFLASWYPQHQDQVDLIALAFERSSSEVMAIKNIKKSLAKLKPPYAFFLATSDSQEEVSSIIPQVKKLTAYPTTFILDKTGKTRYVHVGFNGPQTGHHYDQFVKEFEKEIQTLINE